MADVYRYILDNKNKELVSLRTEIAFVEAFIFLLQIRFNQNLIFLNQIPRESPFRVAPFSLQLLVENAVKHNIVSEESPLTIELFLENEFIIVKNNKQLKRTSGYCSGIGLKNLSDRYSYLTTKKVAILNNELFFLVKIPSLVFQKENDESTFN